MESKTILIAEVTKTFKDHVAETKYHYIFTSFDRDKLIEYIRNYFFIVLIKDDKDEFPYFTDGGFRFTAERDIWKFEITAHPQTII